MSSEEVFNKSLFEACQAMVSSGGIREVLDTILHLTMQALRADAGSILLYEAESDELKMLAARGLPPGVIERGYLARKDSVTEQVLRCREPLILNGVVEPSAEEDGRPTPAARIRSALCVPLQVKGQTIGTVNLNRYSDGADSYSPKEQQIVTILASQAAISIENARLQSENLAQARMAAIGQTVAGISHCIKNLLTGLRGGIDLIDIAQNAKDWKAIETASGLLSSSVERVSVLVYDMLDYTKANRLPARREMAIALLFHDVCEVTRYKAEKKSIEFCTEIEAGCEKMSLDPDQLFRCLLNLVENAIDALADGGGRIVMRCSGVSQRRLREVFGPKANLAAMGRVVCLTVEDNGSGIAPDHLRRVFEPFFSTKKSRGTGLGLSVTRKIVEEHGGRAVVDSELGEGTRFHLLVPEYSERDASPQPEQPAEKPEICV